MKSQVNLLIYCPENRTDGLFKGFNNDQHERMSVVINLHIDVQNM
jgi:hypothetical protein